MDAKTAKTKTLQFYSLFLAGMIIALIPLWQTAALATIIMVLAFFAAYPIRKNHADTLYGHHADFILRTCWIAVFISFITLIPTSIWMITQIDYSAFEICAHTLVNTLGANAQNASPEQAYTAAKPCIEPFISENMRTLVIATLASAAPVLMYTYYRLFKGTWYASKGQNLPNVKSWL